MHSETITRVKIINMPVVRTSPLYPSVIPPSHLSPPSPIPRQPSIYFLLLYINLHFIDYYKKGIIQ